MTTNNINSKLKEAATIWQLIFGLGSTVVVVTAFLLSMKADANSHQKDIDRHEKTIEQIRLDAKEVATESKQNQRQILDDLNEIKLQLKDKQDRK